MASKQFIDKLNEYNEWYSIPRANDYLPCPVVFENLDGSNFPVYQYITRFISVVFKNCNFNRSNFATCIFLNCTFEGCTFNYTEFKFNQIVHCKFCECDLTKFNVQYTDFWADFDDGNMQLSVSLSHFAALHSGHSVKLDWRRTLHCCSPRPIQRSPLYVPPVTIQDIP